MGCGLAREVHIRKAWPIPSTSNYLLSESPKAIRTDEGHEHEGHEHEGHEREGHEHEEHEHEGHEHEGMAGVGLVRG